MMFSTHCIVLKMTYDMRDLTYFLTCKVNIMSFSMLSSWRGLVVNLNIHINVMNYLLVLSLQEKGSNKLQRVGCFCKWMSSLKSCLKNLRQGIKIKDFQKDRSIGRPLDWWWLNFKNFDYVSTHFNHFSKCEAAISELQATFEILYVWLKRAQYYSISTKYLWITAKKPDIVNTERTWFC